MPARTVNVYWKAAVFMAKIRVRMRKRKKIESDKWLYLK